MSAKHHISDSVTPAPASQLSSRKVVRRKPKGTVLQRMVYWLMLVLIGAILLYAGAEIGWTIYSNT